MKILIITEFFPQDRQLKFTGGVEAYNYYLTQTLSKKNSVTVIAKGNTSKIVNKGRLKIIFIKSNLKKVDTSFSTFPDRIRFVSRVFIEGLKEDFDVVQGTNFVTYFISFFIGYFKKKPTIAWYPDVFIGRWYKLVRFPSSLVGELIERVSIKLPWNKFIALSNVTREKLIKMGVDKNKIVTIYAGVRSSKFKKRNKKNEVFTIVSIARLVSYKRIDLLIKAAKILNEQGLKFQINIIGDGPMKQDLINLINDLDLNKLIKIKSNLTNHKLIQRLEEADLFCLPSEAEGFGMVLIEAASMGIPLLVSDIPIFKEVTKQGLGALFFKAGDVEDLVVKTSMFYKDANLQKRLLIQSLKLAESYDWKKIAQQFEEEYKNITNKNNKILISIDAWFPHVGGGQTHVWELAKKIADRGFKVTIVTRNNGKWEDNYRNIKVVRLGIIKNFSNILGRIEFLILSYFYILFQNYDLLHLFAFSSGLLAPLIRPFKKKPIIYTVLGEGIKISGLPFGEHFLQDLVFYKIYYDLEITVSKNVIKKPVSAKKLVFISNGVLIEQFKDAMRSRIKIEKILCVARLFYDKGVDMLIEAFKKLRNNKLKLIIVGDGPEESVLKKLAKGIKNIEFWGTKKGEDYIKVMREADLAVIPSRTEGLPLRLLDSWSAKLPVLATKAGDTDLYIKDGENGFLVTPDVLGIYEGLLRVLQNRNLRKIADRGFNEVQKYSWDDIADKTIKEYKKLL